MGGEVSRAKLHGGELQLPTDACNVRVPGTCVPVNCRMVCTWLSTSGLPVTRQHIMDLYTHAHVRTLITLTLVPLGAPMALNCAQAQLDSEWAYSDTDMLEGLPPDLRMVHLPMPDSHPLPTPHQVAVLLREAEAARAAGTRLHLHCWVGQTRSVLMARLAAMLHCNRDLLDARVNSSLWLRRTEARDWLQGMDTRKNALRVLTAPSSRAAAIAQRELDASRPSRIDASARMLQLETGWDAIRDAVLEQLGLPASEDDLAVIRRAVETAPALEQQDDMLL